MKVQLIENLPPTRCHSESTENLRPGKIYEVLGIAATSFRLLNEFCDLVLFDSNRFTVIDSTLPDHWVLRISPEGALYTNPPTLSGRRFYENLNDRCALEAKLLHDYVLAENIVDEQEWLEGLHRSPWSWAKVYLNRQRTS